MKIKGSFLDKFLNTELKLSEIEPYFLNYNKEDWDSSNSGYFSYDFNEGEIILYFVDCLDVGISLRYDFNVPNKKEKKKWYSVGNKEKLNELIDANDQYFVPKGSCLDIKTAWLVISNFFENPLNKSNQIEWIEDEKIDWSTLDYLY